MAAPGTSQNDSQQDSSAGNANRVWVGNLAYKSSEQELRDAFAGMKMWVFCGHLHLVDGPNIFLVQISACRNGSDADKATLSSRSRNQKMWRKLWLKSTEKIYSGGRWRSKKQPVVVHIPQKTESMVTHPVERPGKHDQSHAQRYWYLCGKLFNLC